MTDNNISYEEVLKPAKKMSMDMVKKYSMVGNMPEEKKAEAIREIMMQPYMEEIYNGYIEPRDVKEFVEAMANSSPSKKTSIISAFAHNVLSSDDLGDASGSIDNIREKLVLMNKIQSQIEGDMTKFAEKKEIERTPAEPEKVWWKKAFNKAAKVAGNAVRAFAMAGGIALLAGGTYLGVKTYIDEKNNSNSYGIVPNNNTNEAMKNARNKLEKDTKTSYDAFSRTGKKAPVKGQSNMRGGGMELS